MLVLLAGYFGDPARPAADPGVGLDRAGASRDPLPRRRDRRGRRPARRARAPTCAGTTRWRSSPGTSCSPAPRRSPPTSGPTSAACSPARSPCCATARSARSTARPRSTRRSRNYLEIIRRKTASLIATSCRLGGMLSDATPEDTRRARGVRRRARHGLPALRRHHGHHRRARWSSARSPARTCGRASTRCRCSTPSRTTSTVRSSRGPAPHGPPDGELLDRALEIVRSDGSIEHARAAVTAEVVRATTLARRLPEGPAQHALIQLAEVPGGALRRGADEPAGMTALLESAARIRALGRAFTGMATTYYASYGVVLAVLVAGAVLVAVAFGSRQAHRAPPAAAARSSRPTSAASTRWARAGPRARSATTSTGSCS